MSKSHASSFADLSCWEPQHGAFFAVVTDQNKIRIFDTRTNEQVQDLSLPLQLSTVYSSLHWSQPTHTAPKVCISPDFLTCRNKKTEKYNILVPVIS
jgi:hypothetical protein